MTKTAIHVYCDESGNTGSALLDPEQPIFSLASTCIETALARDLCPLARQGQKEAKYAKLKGSPRGQSQLIEFFSSAAINQTNCKFTLADKKFYLVSHMVDKLIEPPLHEAAIDLYAADAHVRLANIWYFGGDLIFPNGGWKAVQVAFLNAIRRCNATSSVNLTLLSLRRPLMWTMRIVTSRQDCFWRAGDWRNSLAYSDMWRHLTQQSIRSHP